VIEFVHDSDVDRNEDHEDVNAALLGEPETELKATDSDLVERLNKEDSAAVGNDEPNSE
jgi:hypothetical protein